MTRAGMHRLMARKFYGQKCIVVLYEVIGNVCWAHRVVLLSPLVIVGIDAIMRVYKNPYIGDG